MSSSADDNMTSDDEGKCDVVLTFAEKAICEGNRTCLGYLMRMKPPVVLLLDRVLRCVETKSTQIISFSHRAFIGIDVLLKCMARSLDSQKPCDAMDYNVQCRTVKAYVLLYSSVLRSGSRYRRFRSVQMCKKFFIQRESFLPVFLRAFLDTFDVCNTQEVWDVVLPAFGLLYSVLGFRDGGVVYRHCQDFISVCYSQCLSQHASIDNVDDEHMSYIASALTNDSLSMLLVDLRRYLLRDASFTLPILHGMFRSCESLSSMDIVSQLFIPLRDNLLSRDDKERKLAANVIAQMINKYTDSEPFARSIISLCGLLNCENKGADQSIAASMSNQHRFAVAHSIKQCIRAVSDVDMTPSVRRITICLMGLVSYHRSTTSSSVLFDEILEIIALWSGVCAANQHNLPADQLANIPGELDNAGVIFDDLSLSARRSVIRTVSHCSGFAYEMFRESKLFKSIQRPNVQRAFNFPQQVLITVDCYTCLCRIKQTKDPNLAISDCSAVLETLLKQYIEMQHKPSLDICFTTAHFHESLKMASQAWLFLIYFLYSSDTNGHRQASKDITLLKIEFRVKILQAYMELLRNKDLCENAITAKRCELFLNRISKWPSPRDIQNVENPHRHDFVFSLLMSCALLFKWTRTLCARSIDRCFAIPFALFDQLGNTHLKLLVDFRNPQHPDFDSQTCAIALGIVCHKGSFVGKQATDTLIVDICRDVTHPDCIYNDLYHAKICNGTDGVLVDEDVIDTLIELEARDNKHMKKQGHVYSFEEQMSDFNLRREMLKTDKWKSQLTDRQSIQLQHHLSNEALLRARIRTAKARYEHLVACVKCILTTNFEYTFACYFNELFRIIAAHLSSTVTSAIAYELLMIIKTRLRLDTLEFLCLLVGLCSVNADRTPRIPDNMYTAVLPYNSSASRLVDLCHTRYVCTTLVDSPFRGGQMRLNYLPTHVLACLDPLFKYVYSQSCEKDISIALDILNQWCKYITCKPNVRIVAMAHLQAILSLSTSCEKCTEFQLVLVDTCTMLFRLCVLGQTATPTGCSPVKVMLPHHRSSTAAAKQDSLVQQAICHNLSVSEVMQKCLQHLGRLDRPLTVTAFLVGLRDCCDVISSLSFATRQKIASISSIYRFTDSDAKLRQAAEEITIACRVPDSDILSVVVTYSLAKSHFVAVPAVKCLVELILANDERLCADAIAQIKNCGRELIEKSKNKQEQNRYVLDDVTGRVSSSEDGVGRDDVRDHSFVQYSKCIRSMVSHCPGHYDLFDLIRFLIEEILTIQSVRIPAEFLTIALDLVDKCSRGKEYSAILEITELIEGQLARVEQSKRGDRVKTSLLVLLGASVKNMQDNPEKIEAIIEQLIESLKTQSEVVQESIGNSLAMLAPLITRNTDDLLSDLYTVVHKGKVISERRGAAFGIAGIVKGLDLLKNESSSTVDRIEERLQNTADHESRVAGLLITNAYVRVIGRAFEICLVHLVPRILVCMSDKMEPVRGIAAHCAKNIMTCMSSQGLHVILPAILEGLKSDKWRTKCGASDLLGAISYCDQKQLSHTLPLVVPALIDMAHDAHMRVRAAGRAALDRIASAVASAEVRPLVPALLRALESPDGDAASQCIGELHRRQFASSIDPVALAILMPVLRRGFGDRILAVRQHSGDVILRIVQLTSLKDLAAYIDDLRELFKQRIFDPVPEIREISSNVLASTMRKESDLSVSELTQWLYEKIADDKSAVCRMGAAQCLCEVALAQGEAALEQQMSNALDQISHSDQPYLIHGYFTFCFFVSKRSQAVFGPRLQELIPNVIKCLAHETEVVRDAAYMVGQAMIELYFDDSAITIVRQIEAHLFDTDWRIRFSSLKLLCEILFRLVGQSEAGEMGQSDRCYVLLCKQLGSSQVDRVLMELFVLCNDEVAQVAQLSVHIWRVVITNPAILLNQILPSFLDCLLNKLVECKDEYVRFMMARSLGDLARRVGPVSFQRVLTVIFDQVSASDEFGRKGICAALKEIFASSSRDSLVGYFEPINELLTATLCDASGGVRDAAADAFVVFDRVVGRHNIVDHFLPGYIALLTSARAAGASAGDRGGQRPGAADGFESLLKAMDVSFGNCVLNALLRSTRDIPMELLICVCEALGAGGLKYIDHICMFCLDEIKRSECKASCILRSAQTISRITDKDTSKLVIAFLAQKSNVAVGLNDHSKWNIDVVNLITAFIGLCPSERLDESLQTLEHIAFSLCLRAYDKYHIGQPSSDAQFTHMWTAGCDLLEQLIKRLSTDHYLKLFNYLDRSIRGLKYLKPVVNRIPGFNLKGQGARSMMGVYRNLLASNVTDEAVELTVSSLLEFIRYVSNDSIRSSALPLMGSIIRMLGEKRVDRVKRLMMSLLNAMLPITGDQLKVFSPQLMPTYTRLLLAGDAETSRLALGGFRQISALRPRTELLLRGVHSALADDVTIDRLRVSSCGGDDDVAIGEIRRLADWLWTLSFALAICAHRVPSSLQASDLLQVEQMGQMNDIVQRLHDFSRLVTGSGSGANGVPCLSAYSEDLVTVLNRLGAVEPALELLVEPRLTAAKDDTLLVELVDALLEPASDEVCIPPGVCVKLCLLVFNFPQLIVDRPDMLNRMSELCQNVLNSADALQSSRMDAVRLLGFILLASDTGTGAQTQLEAIKDCFVKILLDDRPRGRDEMFLIKDFLVHSVFYRSSTCGLQTLLISVATSNKARLNELKDSLLDELLQLLQFPDKFPELSAKYNMCTGNGSTQPKKRDFGATGDLTASLTKRYGTTGLPKEQMVHADAGHLFGWV